MTTDLLNNSDFEFNPDAVDNIDQSTVEGGGPSYPILQWVYGDMKARKAGGIDYLGGFAVKADKVDAAAMEAAGWTKTERTYESGASEEVYWKREAALSVIAERKRWEVTPDDGKRVVFPWNKYDAAKTAGNGKGAHGRTQYLVLVKGLESVGPFVFTTKGAASQAFEDYRNAGAVLTRFSNTVIRAANAASDAAAKKGGKAAGKRWPFRAFWLPVGADRDAKDQPNYTEVGRTAKSKVVLPIALGLPDKAEQVDLKRFYIGNDLLTTVNELFDAAAEWRSSWDNLKPGAVEGNGEAAQVEAQAEADKEDAALAATGL